MIKNDLINELSTNFIEYAVACNTDRAIPDATTGLKPVAKRISASLKLKYPTPFPYGIWIKKVTTKAKIKVKKI